MKGISFSFGFTGLNNIARATRDLNAFADALSKVNSLGGGSVVAGMAGGGLTPATGGGRSGGGGGGYIRKPPKLPGPPDPMKDFNNLIYSTRFGAGNAMPLVGRTFKFLESATGIQGLSKMAGPITLAVVGLTALYKATEAASQALLDYSKARYMGGGTAGQTKTGLILGGALGTDFASDARRVQELAAQGGTTTALARRFGLRSVSGFGRDPNASQFLLNILKGISQMKGGAQTKALQDFGLQGYGAIYDLSKKEQQSIYSGKLGTGGDLNAADGLRFNLALSDLKMQLIDLAPAIKPVVEQFIVLSKILSGSLGMLKFWSALFNGEPSSIMGPRGGKGKSVVDEQINATNENTRAIQANTEAIRKTIGGGNYAAGAYPAGWRHQMFDEAAFKRAVALGAFPV